MMEEQVKTGESACVCKGHGSCKCMHHKVVPAMISLIGLVLLLGALNIVAEGTVAVLWPIFLLVAGLTKLSKGACKCC